MADSCSTTYRLLLLLAFLLAGVCSSGGVLASSLSIARSNNSIIRIRINKNEKHKSANPRHNLTEMLHALRKHWYETELYQTNDKCQGVIYRASFQHRLH